MGPRCGRRDAKVRARRVRGTWLLPPVPFHHPHFTPICFAIGFLGYCGYRIAPFPGRKGNDILQRNRKMHAYLCRHSFVRKAESTPRVMFKYLLTVLAAHFKGRQEASAACSAGWKNRSTLRLKTFLSKMCTSY